MKLVIIAIISLVLVLFAFNASAGCGRWVVRDNTDYLKDPTFDALTSGQDETSPVSSPQDSLQASPQAKAKDSSASIGMASGAKVLDISGKWLADFGDNSTALNLILIQSGSRVQGYGSFKGNGAETPATIVGSISGNAVSLDVKPVMDGSVNKVDETNKLELKASNGVLSGTYEIYIDDKLTEKGNAIVARL